jgi:plastocyanin
MSRRPTTLLTWLALIFLLAACGGQEAAPTAAPTAAPSVEPTSPPPTEAPTAFPTEAPAPTEAPPPTPTAEPLPRVGLLRFSDNDTVRAGSFTLEMLDLPPAPAGQHYELWLVNEFDQTTRDLGPFTVDGGRVTFSGDTDTNLFAVYSGALVTLEADGAAGTEPTSEAVYRGFLAGEAVAFLRQILIAAQASPGGKGHLVGAQDETLLAQEHGGLLQEALSVGNLLEAKLHAEHVVNILDGETGEKFGDLDGDGRAQNPGDGRGVRVYLDSTGSTIEQLLLVATSNEVILHAGHVAIALDNARLAMDQAMNLAGRITSVDSVAEAQPLADELELVLATLLEGTDADGDGAIAPVPGEGTVNTAYQHALFAAGIELYPAATGAVEAPAGPGAVDIEATVAAALTVTPEAATPAGGAPPPVTINMLDFSFDPVTIEVPAGTTITWVNVGDFQHSATADDGSWDTGLFDSGGRASITFDTPGTYPYYCILHGTPGGNGMSGVIIVVAP